MPVAKAAAAAAAPLAAAALPAHPAPPFPPPQLYWEKKFPSYECAGDYGVPKMTKDPTKLKELELMELKNGRLAMIGIISFACAEAIPGSVPFYPF